MRINEEKAKLQKAIANQPWCKAIGIGGTADEPEIVLSVSKGALRKAKAALSGIKIDSPVVVREVGRIAMRRNPSAGPARRKGATAEQAEALFEAARSSSFSKK